jgi:hypothetical protein
MASITLRVYTEIIIIYIYSYIYYRLTQLSFIKIQTIKIKIKMATCFSPYRAIIRPYRMCVQDWSI